MQMYKNRNGNSKRRRSPQSGLIHTYIPIHAHTNVTSLIHAQTHILTLTHVFGYTGLNGYKHIYTSDTVEKTVPCLDHSCLWEGGAQPVWLPSETDRQTEGEKTVCVCVCVKAAARNQLPLNQQRTDQTQTHTGWSVYTSLLWNTKVKLSDTHTHTHTVRRRARKHILRGQATYTHTRVEEVCYLSVEERENCWRR